jgi:hypothetical protein
MAERKRRKRQAKVTPATAMVRRTREGDEAERSLGRLVVIGLPAACVVAAIAVGVTASVGSALLIVAAGALLGTIALLWASVRTLSGDAPLPAGFEALAVEQHGVDVLAEEKRRVLRQLKDLEAEHALGKIDDADFQAVAAKYREEAKAVMRQMDLEVAPLREEAERIAREYLAKRGVLVDEPSGQESTSDSPVDGIDGAPQRDEKSPRLACKSCGTSNEPDAAFCKKCGGPVNAAAAAQEKSDAP